MAYVTIENPTDFRMKLAVNCYVHGISYDAIAPFSIPEKRGRRKPRPVWWRIMNEVDGNLTIWVEAPYQLKFHWNRVRGPEFEPRYFRIEKLSCPEIVDKQGRQILMPVLRPTTAQAVEEREAVESKTDIAFLRALMATPEASQRDLGLAADFLLEPSIRKFSGSKRPNWLSMD